MTSAPTELVVSLSKDMRLAAAVGDLVRCAMQNAGCNGPAADRFLRQVQDAVTASLGADGHGRAMVAVTLRTRDGAVEVLVAGRTLTLDT